MRKNTPEKSHGKLDLNFLFELGSLRHLQRTWCQFGGLRMANDSEHSFRVAFLAWMIAEREGVDTSRVVKMALVHDMTETRTGDTHHISRLYTERNEKSAVTDMTEGVILQDEVRGLWHEYEWRETLAAKIVKDADTLDVDLEVMEGIARGEKLCEMLYEKRPVVGEKLFTETAKRMFRQIRESNPNDWVYAAKNRFNQGDWKQ